MVANKIDMVEEDDRMKGYGRFANTHPRPGSPGLKRRCFSDPELTPNRNNFSNGTEFSAQQKGSNLGRKESLTNIVRESHSPAQMSPSRASKASRLSRSSHKKPPVVATIKLNTKYDPEQYYEGGYGEEVDESEDDPEINVTKKNR